MTMAALSPEERRHYARLLLPEVLQVARTFPVVYPGQDRESAALLGFATALERYERGRGSSVRTYVKDHVRFALQKDKRSAAPIERSRYDRLMSPGNTEPFQPHEQAPQSLEQIVPGTYGKVRLGETLLATDGDPEAMEWALVVAQAQSIPEREQLIVRLYFWEGLSYEEIAPRVGLSHMQVGRLVRRALQRLRGVLGTEQP